MTRRELYQSKLSEVKKKLGSNTSLLIVSKTRTIEEITYYYDLGHRDFGENRVQELLEKSIILEERCPEIRWHMIGHLQTNKVKQLFKVHNLWAIHSVDSEKLVNEIVKLEGLLNSKVRIFLQVNTSQEIQKSGFESLEELTQAAELLNGFSKIELYGLMTMGTLRTTDFVHEARRCFHELNNLRDSLSEFVGQPLKTSMGMSQDYEIALLEKSNWIRLGTMMFE